MAGDTSKPMTEGAVRSTPIPAMPIATTWSSGLARFFRRSARRCLVHGEPDAAQGLADSLSAARLERPRILAPKLDQAFGIVFRDGRWQTLPSQAATAPRVAPAQASAARDWHNDYAAALLDLRHALQQRATTAGDSNC